MGSDLGRAESSTIKGDLFEPAPVGLQRQPVPLAGVERYRFAPNEPKAERFLKRYPNSPHAGRLQRFVE